MLGEQGRLTLQFGAWRKGDLDYRRAKALAKKLDPESAVPPARGWRVVPKIMPVDVMASPALIRMRADHPLLVGKTALYGATVPHQGKVLLPAVRVILSSAKDIPDTLARLLSGLKGVQMLEIPYDNRRSEIMATYAVHGLPILVEQREREAPALQPPVTVPAMPPAEVPATGNSAAASLNAVIASTVPSVEPANATTPPAAPAASGESPAKATNLAGRIAAGVSNVASAVTAVRITPKRG